MKITKRQLKRIIKEEKAQLLERMGGLEAHGPDDYTMYQVHPTQFVDAAKEYLTDEEFSAIGQDKIEGIAIDNANELAWSMQDSLEGFGSSDRAAYIKYYLEDLGSYAKRNGLPSFTADWKGPRGSLQIVREGKMKITERQLRRIIKEATRSKPWAFQTEAASPKTADEWVEHLGQIIDQDMTSRGLTSYKEEGAAVVEALEKLRREITDEMRGPTR
jgi:hypothetical protein